MLSQEQIEKYKNRLIEQKQEIESKIKGFDKRPDFENEPGWEDEANESVASFDESGEETAYRHKMSDIESALVRIEKGEYGICRSCNQEIEEDILDIVPESELCKECKKSGIV